MTEPNYAAMAEQIAQMERNTCVIATWGAVSWCSTCGTAWNGSKPVAPEVAHCKRLAMAVPTSDGQALAALVAEAEARGAKAERARIVAKLREWSVDWAEHDGKGRSFEILLSSKRTAIVNRAVALAKAADEIEAMP